jgi:hypothetical protein
MRALNLYGLLGVSVVLFGACGGESGLSPDGPGSEAGEAGQGPSNPPGEGGVGGESSTTGGVGGDSTPSKGGNVSKGGTGGTGVGAAGGKGGGTPATGGRSMAGAPSTGGSKTMPEAGAPNVPEPPEPPEGCQPQSLSASINDCSLQLVCDGNRYVYAYCGNQGTGAWACQCESNKYYDQYSVTGVTGAAACSTIAAFCASGEDPETGPEECSDGGSSRETSYCSVSESCVRPFDIDGVEAGILRTRYANCSSNGSTQECYCQIDQLGNQLQFQISGQDGTTACDTVLDLCEDPTPDLGEPVCVPQFSSGAVGYCESQMQCTQTAEVADGVFASVTDNRYVYCSSQGSTTSGRSMCNCSNNRSQTRFDVEVPTDAALCSQVTAGCDASSVELAGPITCAPASQSAGSGYCNAQVDCKQAGTVGDLELWMYGSLYTDCSLINGAWTCNCTTGTEREQIEVEADSDWEACTAAVQACPDVVDVKIGESNGGIFPPGIPRPL